MSDDILTHLPDAVRLTHTRYGVMLYPSNDIFIGRCLRDYGEYGPEEGNAFRQLVRSGDVVFDVGANIGSHTVLLAALVGETGQVHAFEPQRLVFQMLCANLALNNVANVHARQQGLGRAPGVLRVTTPGAGSPANYGGVHLAPDGAESVEIATLDSFGLERLDFMKIDVEGMEEAVIRGGAETIRRFRPKLYLENDAAIYDRVDISASLIRTVRDLGYRCWWHVAPLYSPDNFRGLKRDIFGQNVVSVNMLCIRDDEQVQTNYEEIVDERAIPHM